MDAAGSSRVRRASRGPGAWTVVDTAAVMAYGRFEDVPRGPPGGSSTTTSSVRRTPPEVALRVFRAQAGRQADTLVLVSSLLGETTVPYMCGLCDG